MKWPEEYSSLSMLPIQRVLGFLKRISPAHILNGTAQQTCSVVGARQSWRRVLIRRNSSQFGFAVRPAKASMTPGRILFHTAAVRSNLAAVYE
jgi:hypothetical protein